MQLPPTLHIQTHNYPRATPPPPPHTHTTLPSFITYNHTHGCIRTLYPFWPRAPSSPLLPFSPALPRGPSGPRTPGKPWGPLRPGKPGEPCKSSQETVKHLIRTFNISNLCTCLPILQVCERKSAVTSVNNWCGRKKKKTSESETSERKPTEIILWQ